MASTRSAGIGGPGNAREDGFVVIMREGRERVPGGSELGALCPPCSIAGPAGVVSWVAGVGLGVYAVVGAGNARVGGGTFRGSCEWA